MRYWLVTTLILLGLTPSLAQTQPPSQVDKAAAAIARAVTFLGGDRYLQVTSQVGKGSFSSLRKGGVANYQSFSDAIIFPDKERTDFKGSSRSVQVNVGDTGWIWDGEQDVVKAQLPAQIDNFKRGIRTSLDNLLRGYWKGQAQLSYVGRRQGGIGKRNDVLKLTYNDGFMVEYEIADDGSPVKSSYSHVNVGDEQVKDEDRYAQFVDVNGVKVPFIIDHYLDGEAVSRINYESIELNKRIPESVFSKPSSAKEAKKSVTY